MTQADKIEAGTNIVGALTMLMPGGSITEVGVTRSARTIGLHVTKDNDNALLILTRDSATKLANMLLKAAMENLND